MNLPDYDAWKLATPDYYEGPDPVLFLEMNNWINIGVRDGQRIWKLEYRKGKFHIRTESQAVEMEIKWREER